MTAYFTTRNMAEGTVLDTDALDGSYTTFAAAGESTYQHEHEAHEDDSEFQDALDVTEIPLANESDVMVLACADATATDTHYGDADDA
jgi:hypothetical protein